MEEEMKQDKGSIEECAGRISAAAEALQTVLEKVEAQYEALNRKVDRIVAAVEAQAVSASSEEKRETPGRKTLPALVSTLLAKGGVADLQVESATLDKALRTLSIEQRIAVKTEMARAGMLV